jgi:hypothetical protein
MRSGIWILVVALLGSTLPSAAEESTKGACLHAYETGQRTRFAGKLVESRALLMVCARDECPAALRPECARWLDQVGASIPSVVIRLRRSDGSDVTEAKLFVDGTLTASSLGWAPIEMDPGQHTLRVEPRGSLPIERTLLLREGEKERVVDLTLASPSTSKELFRESRPVTWPVYTAAGVTAGAGITWTIFGVKGIADFYSTGNSGSVSEKDSVQRELRIADVAAVLTLFTAGITTYLFLARPTVRVSVTPARGGGAGVVVGTF